MPLRSAGGAVPRAIGLARQGEFRPGARVLFIHNGGRPSLHACERVALGDKPAS